METASTNLSNVSQQKLHSIEVKPYCTIELCQIYKVAPNTFKKWLIPFKKEIGEKRGRYYSVLQVRTIFDKLGLPYRIYEIVI